MRFLAVFGSLTVVGLLLMMNLRYSVPEVSNVSIPKESFSDTTKTITDSSVKTIYNIDLSKGEVVLLVDEVNAISTEMVITGIRAAKKAVFLLIDSPGGNVMDGARIVSEIQSAKVPVYTVCLSLCASMAAIILEYGTERYMLDRSIVMFHPASIQMQVSGEVDKVQSRLGFLQRYVDKMDHFVAKRAGMEYANLKARTTQELWLDAEDALDMHLADKIVKVDTSSLSSTAISNELKDKINVEWK